MSDTNTMEPQARQYLQTSEIEAGAKLSASEIEARRAPATIEIERPITPFPAPSEIEIRPRRRRVLPLLVTLITVVIAVVLGQAMWDAYMVRPGRAMAPCASMSWRWHHARLCRGDGAGGRRAHRRAAGPRQPVRL